MILRAITRTSDHPKRPQLLQMIYKNYRIIRTPSLTQNTSEVKKQKPNYFF